VVVVQFWSRSFPIKQGRLNLPPFWHDQLYPIFPSCSIIKVSSFCNLIQSNLFCGHPCFLWPYSLKPSEFLRASSPSVLKTCPYHRTLFAYCQIFHRSSQYQHVHQSINFFLPISFAPHIALTIALSSPQIWQLFLILGVLGCLFPNIAWQCMEIEGV